MLKLAYTFFIGILLAIFVGYGIATFYSGPVRPQAPNIVWQKSGELSPQDQQAERQFNDKMAAYDESMKPYNRNVALLALGAAVLFVAIGLIFDRRITILADGVMLGGVFTLVYSLGRSFASQNNKFSFAMVSVALAISGMLGYMRFVRAKPAPVLNPKKA